MIPHMIPWQPIFGPTQTLPIQMRCFFLAARSSTTMFVAKTPIQHFLANARNRADLIVARVSHSILVCNFPLFRKVASDFLKAISQLFSRPKPEHTTDGYPEVLCPAARMRNTFVHASYHLVEFDRIWQLIKGLAH